MLASDSELEAHCNKLSTGVVTLTDMLHHNCIFLVYSHSMMTSSNGNSFRVTGHLCREFTGPRVTWGFYVFFDLRPNKRLSKQSRGWWFETPSRPLCRHRNGLWKTPGLFWYNSSAIPKEIMQNCFVLWVWGRCSIGYADFRVRTNSCTRIWVTYSSLFRWYAVIHLNAFPFTSTFGTNVSFKWVTVTGMWCSPIMTYCLTSSSFIIRYSKDLRIDVDI